MNQPLPKGPPSLKKKLPLSPVVILLLFVVVVLSLSATVYLLTTSKNLEPPSKAVGEPKTEPTVALKIEYTNPFSPEAQFVNPFDYYKSPLFSLKK